MKRLQVQYRIIDLMSRWVISVKGASKISLTDLNTMSETILIPLLREVYDLPDLRNLNTESSNFPGIDLADDNKRVAIQVTSTATSRKIKHTLTEFIENEKELYKLYDRLIVYILVEKQKTYRGKGFDEIVKGHFEFDKKKDILDYRDLLEVISGFQIDQARRILEILKKNFGGEEKPPPLELPERPLHFRNREEELKKLLEDIKPGRSSH